MTPLSDQELEALLNDLESDRAERKEAWAGSAPDKVRQAICAFANDLPNYQQPGIVFIGAKNDGSPSDIDVTDQLLLTLSDIKSDGKIVPPPTLTGKVSTSVPALTPTTSIVVTSSRCR